MRRIHKRHRDVQRRAAVGVCSCCGGERYPGWTGWFLAEDLCTDCGGLWRRRGALGLPLPGGEVRT